MPTYTVTMTRTLELSTSFALEAVDIETAEEEAGNIADDILAQTTIEYRVVPSAACTPAQHQELAALALEWIEDEDSINVDDVAET